MGPLAGLFKAAGHDVSGSDIAFLPPVAPLLERCGVRLFPGFAADHLEPRPDLVVVGNVCRASNVEAMRARDLKIPITTMPHALATFFLPGSSPLVVAGTHGKTTTSAMVALILDLAGRNPGFLIGGIPTNFDRSYRLPGGSDLPRRSRSVGGDRPRLPVVDKDVEARRRVPFVVEGDEYDTAFFEKTPKFWHYQPEVGIVTSIEHDHVDIYPDEACYRAAFRGFVDRVPQEGLIVAAAGDAAVSELLRGSGKNVTWFALQDDDFHGHSPNWIAAEATTNATGQTFDLYAGGVFAGRVSAQMPGRHNIRNALAAMAAACEGFGVPLEVAKYAVSAFAGVRRRQELLFDARGVHVYDDFAHHPTAVNETLRALRARHPDGALWAVFEPRTATACRRLHQQQYARAFHSADHVIFAPLGRRNIPEAEQLDIGQLVAELIAYGKRAAAGTSVDDIVERVAAGVQPGDTVALLSNGSFGGIHDKLKEALR
jgi:UDP-N-acetylmuramate: L-alanyl-gamma-D-glutamyl-meso-diaminopimelate ligase